MKQTKLDSLTDQAMDRLLMELVSLGHPTRRAMFGGHGLYIDGVIFALIVGHDVYLKVSDANQQDFEKINSGPFIYEGKAKPVAMSYWLLPAAIRDKPQEWLVWAEKAWNISKKNQKTKPAKKKPK